MNISNKRIIIIVEQIYGLLWIIIDWAKDISLQSKQKIYKKICDSKNEQGTFTFSAWKERYVDIISLRGNKLTYTAVGSAKYGQ